VNNHEYVYRDYHGHTYYRSCGPSFHFGLYYNWGGYWCHRYFYPYYHRRYVFVSLGGYWPIGCTYRRYYWYGYHPYYWYGYYPIACEVPGDTYNYYTYNYYDGSAGYDDVAYVPDPPAQLQPQEPAEETMADRYFDDGVKAFEIGGYATAADLFAKAMALAPDDMILPFAYAQALFANGQYPEAAQLLRDALSKVTPEQEGVFYPRGLYTDEDVLYEQIDLLIQKAELYGFDGDLQLLLGYHMLGIGEIDAAVESLRLANQDFINAPSAAVLLSLAEKLSVEQEGSIN
jgi:tetratricopeptide (TPR) repeat protein